jgi:hypothetical protein
MIAHRRVELNGDIDEAERQRTLPECTSHETSVLQRERHATDRSADL